MLHLRRRLPIALDHLRSVFTFSQSHVFEKEDSKTTKTPKPFDVDRVMNAVHVAEDVEAQLNDKMTSLNEGQKRPSRRRRKKSKMGPREKYLFNKMRKQHKERLKKKGDPASDLNSLYELSQPWFGFSRLDANEEKERIRDVDSYSPEEKDMILKIRETILESRKNQSNLRKENVHLLQAMRGKTTTPFSFSYFRTADRSWNQEIDEDYEEQKRQIISEKIATRLHAAEVTSSRNFVSVESETSSEDESDDLLNQALNRNPTFQRDALEFEAQSKELENPEAWIEKLRSFSRKHEEVLEAMDKGSQQERFKMQLPDSNSIDRMDDHFQRSIVESGVNLHNLEKEARDELKRESKWARRKSF